MTPKTTLTKVNHFRKKYRIASLLAVILMFVMMHVNHQNAFANQTSSYKNEISNVELKLESFDRSGAYDLIKQIHNDLDYNQNPELYLKNLVYMVKIEREYGLNDEMVKHAIELYQKTENENNLKYRIEAIDALAYYDYLNYNNTKMTDKLAEMSNLHYQNSMGGELFQYKLGLAMLEVDRGNKERAIALYHEAIAILGIGEVKENRYFNEVAKVHKSIAGVYFDDKNYKAAIIEGEKALQLIAPLDYDYVIDMKMNMAYYHYELKQYRETQKYIDEINRDYEKTTPLFKKVVSKNSVKRLEANLAYNTGNYKTAANIYYELNQIKDNTAAVEENLAANEAVANFEEAQTNKQVTLLEQLAVEQKEKNQVQKKYLLAAYSTIGLLIFLIFFVLWILWWHYKQKQKLYVLSITDQLTQLYNRRKIVEEFDQIKPGTKCIALMDIDHFKTINDTLGHTVGDEVLKKIAATIKQSLRSQDHVGRYGGEEFLVILDTGDVNVAIEIVERVRHNIENTVWAYGDLKTTISIGLIAATHIGDTLLSEADELLYIAKAEGRNRLSYRLE